MVSLQPLPLPPTMTSRQGPLSEAATSATTAADRPPPSPLLPCSSSISSSSGIKSCCGKIGPRPASAVSGNGHRASKTAAIGGSLLGWANGAGQGDDTEEPPDRTAGGAAVDGGIQGGGLNCQPPPVLRPELLQRVRGCESTEPIFMLRSQTSYLLPCQYVTPSPPFPTLV